MVPRIGMRMVKSAVAVGLCFAIAYFRHGEGIVFYSQLAALWCIQAYVSDTKKYAAQRIVGTVIGALYGLFVLLLWQFVDDGWKYAPILYAAVVSVMIIAVLETTVLIHKKQASYFSCVVFLSIMVNHIGDANPYLFVWNRFLDTVIGIVVGVCVNSFSVPGKKNRDILFVSGLDDILFDSREQMTDYCKAELNRMLDEGMQFAISTVRTPAEVAEMMQGVRLKLPVVAMDGAVLYDISRKEYKKVYVISGEMSEKIRSLLDGMRISYFANVIIDDTLLIYYGDGMKPAQTELVEKLKRSPYRNYVRRPLPRGEKVVYFMVYDESGIVKQLYSRLMEKGLGSLLKIVTHDSLENPGYSYLKIYNKNANKNNMAAYLKQEAGIRRTVTFGSIPGQYDIVVEMGDVNMVVHTLKKLYERNSSGRSAHLLR